MTTYRISEVDDALVVRGTGETLDLWNELRQHYVERRTARRGPGGLRYPETTNRDVRAVITILSRELGRTPSDVTGYDGAAKAWARAAKRARAQMDGRDDDAAFVDNRGFWLRDAKDLAVYLSVARRLPTRTELLADFVALTATAPGSVR